MKNKKILILCIIIIIQLLTPIYLIVSKNYYLKDAEIYKIKTRGYDPYDVFRGKYLAINLNINFEEDVYKYHDYKIIDKDENGYLKVIDSNDSLPDDAINYYKNLNIDRYYMTDKLAEKAEQYMLKNQDKDYYIEVLIKNDKYKVLGLYVNGEPIENLVN